MEIGVMSGHYEHCSPYSQNLSTFGGRVFEPKMFGSQDNEVRLDRLLY